MLGRIVIDKEHPEARKQYIDFKREVLAVKEKNQIPSLYVLSREFGKSNIEIVVLPASDKPGNFEDFKKEGFNLVSETPDLNNLSDLESIKKGTSESSIELEFD